MSGSVEDMSQCAPLGVTCLLFQLANTKAAYYDNGFYTSLALKFFSIVREASSFPVNHSTHNLSLSLVDVDLLVEDD
ncbi:hypothetical protein F2Q70_00022509 [Brassica cretica]|uniref:Uncharacterized protein n=1 Tax=Brassica cretica TaxID=69181 RepID=A0A8S9GKS7_BRACR|nr:hypothetical protein F2Q70_00022509 [Brassica cretica]